MARFLRGSERGFREGCAAKRGRCSLLLVALLALPAAPACIEPPPTAESGGPSQGEQLPELALDGVGLRYFVGSELRATGRAERAFFRKQSGEVTAQDAQTLLLAAVKGRGGVPEDIRVTAPRGKGDIRARTALAEGGVEAKNLTDGTLVVTESFSLDGAARRASGGEPVTMTRTGLVASGERGFIYDYSRPPSTEGEEGAEPGGERLELIGPVKTLLEGRR